MIKQVDLFNGDVLSATEKYDLERKKEDEVLSFINDKFNLDIPLYNQNKRKKRKVVLKEGCYVRYDNKILLVQGINGKNMLVEDVITKGNALLPLKDIIAIADNIYALLKKDDEIYAYLENGVIREFQVMKIFEKDKKIKLQVSDNEDGEVFVVDEKDVYKIRKLY